MKIKKLYEDATDGVLNPDDSKIELADEIVSATAEVTDGDVVLGDEAADIIADEIKKADAEIDVEAAAVNPGENEYLGVKNVITDTLDIALANALKNKRRGGKFGSNVLIIGLPGSGKTATVYDWAHTNNVNLVAVNSKNNDLDAYINGYTTKNPDNPRRVTQAFSDNLAGLEKPRSVLFLDEYNRQIKSHIRASLLTLINEHKIVGEGKNNQHEFKNMLFTIAAINPSVPTDKGAAALNDAEKTRFMYKLKNMDSDPATTIEFLTKFYNKKIAALDKSSEFYREDLEDYLRCLDLGLFVVSHPKFGYDTRDDLEALADKEATMLNQRSFVEGINGTNGDVKTFKHWVEYSSDFLPSNVDMILAILREYIEPSFEELCRARDIDATVSAPVLDDKAEDTPSVSDVEDDDDFFTSSSAAGKVRVKNPAEVEIAISNALKSW
jgi:hypothetical protein